MRRDSKVLLIGMVTVIIIAGTLGLVDPIRQNPMYHRFADQRVWASIPHIGDVLSNIAFAAAGLFGLFAIWADARRPDHTVRIWLTPYTTFFIGIALVSAGSAYYHWAPDNASLVWDRLPMTIAFMGLFISVVTDRMGPSTGKALFVPLLVGGVVSVIYWSYSGDLRPYGLVQFLPIALLVLMCWLFPAHHGLYGKYLGAIFLLYGAAKIFEYYDRQIWDLLGHTLSGHTLKHLFAAAATAAVAWFLYKKEHHRHAHHHTHHTARH